MVAAHLELDLTSQLLEAHALYGEMSYGLESSPSCGVLGVFVGSCSEGGVMEGAVGFYSKVKNAMSVSK